MNELALIAADRAQAIALHRRAELEHLIARGARVRVTNPHVISRPSWTGTIIGLADHPTMLVELDGGRRQALPQAFQIEELPPLPPPAEASVSYAGVLGRSVRRIWVEWARRQPFAKPSWLTPWAQLDAGQQEVDTLIGTGVVNADRARTLEQLASVRCSLTDELGETVDAIPWDVLLHVLAPVGQPDGACPETPAGEPR